MLTRPGDLVLEPHIQELLLTASISTVERNLRPLCLEYRGRRCQHSRPGSALRKEIPVVVTSRDIDIPSYLEIDLVSHSGDYAAGEWVHTLTATDTSPPAGPSGFRSWARVSAASSRPWIASAPSCPSPFVVSTRTTAPSSSTNSCWPGLGLAVSSSPAVGRTTRTTTPTSNRRTAAWSRATSATSASTRQRRWPGSTASTPSCSDPSTTASSLSSNSSAATWWTAARESFTTARLLRSAASSPRGLHPLPDRQTGNHLHQAEPPAAQARDRPNPRRPSGDPWYLPQCVGSLSAPLRSDSLLTDHWVESQLPF